MLINFFKSKKTSAIIVMFGLCILELILSWNILEIPDQAYHRWSIIDLGPLYHQPYLYKGFVVVLLFLEAVFVLRIAYHHVLSEQSNYLSLFVFLILAPVFMSISGLGPIALVFFPLLVALKRLFSLYSTDKDYRGIYDVAVLISIASLFFMPALVFILAIPHALRVYNISFPRHLMIAFFGLITPYLFYATFAYWNDGLELVFACKIPDLIKLQLPRIEQLSPYEMGLFSVMILISLFGVFGFLQTLVDRSIKQRKATGLIAFFAFLSLLSAFIGGFQIRQYAFLLLVPFTLFMSDFFMKKRKAWIHDIIFVILMSALILNILPIL